MLDLTTLEENDVPHVTVAVMPKSKKVVLVTMETRLHVDRFEEILNLARDAGSILHREMKDAILDRSSSLIAKTGPGAQIRMQDDDVMMDS